MLISALVDPNRHEATPAIWQEVYLSALLRAILYADDANYVSCSSTVYFDG